MDILANIIRTEVCPKSCSIIQYSGKVLYKFQSVTNDIPEFAIAYQFAYPESMKVYEEYLIYDAIGMIGSIGGTLGMFIGFSLSNLLTIVINFFQSLNTPRPKR